MKIIFLGTGTSHGVPVVGCKCSVCNSHDTRNLRNRSSIYIKKSGISIIIDTPAEFRLATLKYKIKKVDAVLLTHCHSDHIAGLDDLRRYNELQNTKIPVFGNENTIKEIKNRFSYIFKKTQEGGGKPNLTLVKIKPYHKFMIGKVEIFPILVKHGTLDVMAYRIENFVYMTDVSYIPRKSFNFLKNIKVFVLDALRKEKHPTHFSLSEAIEIVNKTGAKKVYFTHISHKLDHHTIEKKLPLNVGLAYDGFMINNVL